jgi:uncharacterized protein (TIGR02996 family)
MTDSHASFLAAICARPDDDLPRKLYADFLDDLDPATGFPRDPERAEFIRVQCELARLPEYMAHLGGFEPHDTLRRRERELLAYVNFSKWLPVPGRLGGWAESGPPAIGALIGDGSHPATFAFRRGFVEELSCSWQDWQTHADAIRKATPLRKVRLTDQPVLPAGTGLYTPHRGTTRHDDYPGIEFELPREEPWRMSGVDDPRVYELDAGTAAYIANLRSRGTGMTNANPGVLQ